MRRGLNRVSFKVSPSTFLFEENPKVETNHWPNSHSREWSAHKDFRVVGGPKKVFRG